jgi:ABC-type cobalamin/Fe3+-siderophores transport system ATPase subunit
MTNDLVIEITDLVAGYSKRPVLNGLTLQVKAGDCIGVTGANGIGKTTLFKVILGLLRPAQGKVIVFGHELTNEKERRWARCQLGYIPQQTPPGKLPISVHDAVLLGRWGQSFGFGKKPGRQDAQITTAILRRIGLAHKEECDCRYLSGGEQQKVAIARALAREATVLLMDEPTTFLDPAARLELLSLVKNLKTEQGLTFLIISHEPGHLEQLADDVLVMSEGKLRQL